MFISVRVVCATHILPRASRVSYVSFLLEVNCLVEFLSLLYLYSQDFNLFTSHIIMVVEVCVQCLRATPSLPPASPAVYVYFLNF